MRILAGIAALVIRLHPPAWKRRYGTEVLALVEDAPPGVRGTLSLVVSALHEWCGASWRAVVVPSTGIPHAGRVAGLSFISMVTLMVTVAILSWGHAAWWMGIALVSGRPDAAGRVLDSQLRVFASAGIPSLQQAVGIAVAFFLWFILPALPVILVARMSGLGPRYPLLTRVAVTLAFAALFIWLMPPRSMAGALAAGWVFASGWFPRAPAAPSSLVPLRSGTHTS